jgi:phosphoenolpyruvate synthase/pyruvate phosphate dikinase
VAASSNAQGKDLSGSQVEPAIALVPKNTLQKSNQRKRMMGEPVVGDRNAKLSKPPKSAPPAAVLNAAEIQELEDAIAKLERIEAGSKPNRDPLDPSVFNAKYSSGSARPN